MVSTGGGINKNVSFFFFGVIEYKNEATTAHRHIFEMVDFFFGVAHPKKKNKV